MAPGTTRAELVQALADTSNTMGLALSTESYLGDVNIEEPILLKSYAIVLPKIASALGDPTPTRDALTPARDSLAPPR